MKKSFLILSLLFIGCTMFEKEEKLLAEHKKSNGEKIRIYYVGLGATTNDVIQIRREHKHEPIDVFERYNYLQSSNLLNDSSLQIVLNDTGYFKNTPDTFIVRIK